VRIFGHHFCILRGHTNASRKAFVCSTPYSVVSFAHHFVNQTKLVYPAEVAAKGLETGAWIADADARGSETW